MTPSNPFIQDEQDTDTGEELLLSKMDPAADKTEAVEMIPEIQFLRRLRKMADPETRNMMLNARIDYISLNDHASDMANMKFWQVAIKRTPAIITTLVLECIVGLVIARCRNLLKAHILMASFLPILSSIAGNVGMQSSTTTLRALSTGHAVNDLKGIYNVMLKEFLASSVIASIAASLLFLVSLVWSGNMYFAIATSLAVFSNCCTAGVMGSFVPILFRIFGIDPALGTSLA